MGIADFKLREKCKNHNKIEIFFLKKRHMLMVKRSSIPAATMPGQIPQIHTWYTALYLTNQAQFDEMHTCTVHTSFLAHFEYVV